MGCFLMKFKKQKLVTLMGALVLLLSGFCSTATTISAQTNTNSVKSAKVQKNSSIGPGYYDINQTLDIPATRMSTSAFLSQIKPGALETWKRSRVLPSVTAAQAAIESGWGSSYLTTAANNLFGIKGSYHGQSITLPTQEWVNGHYVTINAAFRKYPSWAASIEDHGDFLTSNSRYNNLLGVKDYRQVANLLQQDGYATDPNYASTIISIVQQYGLQAWDQEAFNGTTEPFPHHAIDTSVITVKYDVNNHGDLAYNGAGQPLAASRQAAFPNGSAWRTTGSKIILNQEMFRVSTDEYIPLQYTTVGYDRVITINYYPNYGVNAYDHNGNQISNSNKVFITGSRWRTDMALMINGQIMYRVSTDEYIPKQYTQFGNGN